MEKAGYGKDGVYRSLLPPIVFPTDPNLSSVSFLFKNSDTFPERPALADAISGESLNFVQFKSLVQKVDDSKAKLVTVPQLWDRVENLGLPAVFLDRKISEDGSLGSSNQGIFFQDLVELGAHVSEFPRVSFVQSDTAVLLYSSGTTGISKGVVLTHRNLMASACMLTAEQEINGDGPYVFVCFVPMFHVFGLVVICYSQLMKGNSVVSVERFDLEVVLRAVEKYRVTHLYAVPPVMTALSKQNWAKKYDFSSLKKIVSGAAPLGKEVMEECAKNYRNAKILQGYGHVALSHSSLLKQ